MPRKPNSRKQQVSIVVNGLPISVTLTPPSGTRKSWYAYWKGLKTAKSTGCSRIEDAIAAAEDMLRNGGRKRTHGDLILSDEEFEEIQRRHFGKRSDAKAKVRAKKSLDACLESLSAFREISGSNPVTSATPDDCEKFQSKALTLPKNWRKKYPNSKECVSKIKANTVLKWSRTLQAAFDRANVNAGKKCVRGVVDSGKLLKANPWRQFTWIEGTEGPIRQFDRAELLSILDFLESEYPEVTTAALLNKTFLWSWARREEVVSLKWDALHRVDDEFHFESEGKWGVRKWFRIPQRLYEELQEIRSDSPYVFAAYSTQLRAHYESRNQMTQANHVSETFQPINLGDWFYRHIKSWATLFSDETATPHVFRKTSLQHAWQGEEIDRSVSQDAHLSTNVFLENYVRKTDEVMRQSSNRTFNRILLSLGREVATRYVHVAAEKSKSKLRKALLAATKNSNWKEVARIAGELSQIV